MSKSRPTRTQLELIRRGVARSTHPSVTGGGLINADPRTIRSLVRRGLAWVPKERLFDWRSGTTAYLTRAAYVLVGAEPPPRHPSNNDLPWP